MLGHKFMYIVYGRYIVNATVQQLFEHCVSDDFTFKCLYTIFPSITNQVDKNISCLLYSNLVEFCFDYKCYMYMVFENCREFDCRYRYFQ